MPNHDPAQGSTSSPPHGPIEVRPAPGAVFTVQRTSKRWKALMLLGLFLLGVGVALGAWLIARDPRSLDRPSLALILAALVALFGLALLVFARAGAWWNHG